jgi:hypothetical protein
MDDPHGRLMAQSAWAVTGNNPFGPRFLLLNANTMTMFKCATRYLAEIEKVDIALFSQNFPYGNFDGTGFINEYVNRVTALGTIWINAAGNYGGKVYTGPVEDGKNLQVRITNDQTPVDITLAWSGMSNDQTIGTDKDLDLEVRDDRGQLLAVKNFRQNRVEVPPGPDGRAHDLHPYETASLVLDKTDPTDSSKTSRLYQLRVVKKSGGFNASDKMRVTVESAPEKGVEFLDASLKEEIMQPADNPNGITVGAIDRLSSIGPTLSGLSKPEIVMERASIATSTQTSVEQGGSSFAAAFLAGIVAQLKAEAPALTREDVLKFIAATRTEPLVQRLPRPGTLDPKAQPISFARLKEAHAFGKDLTDWIETEAPQTPVQPVANPDGTYVFTVPSLAPAVSRIHESLAQSGHHYAFEDLEYYLSVKLEADPKQPQISRRVPFWAVRIKDSVVGAPLNRPYPWEKLPGYSKQDFIEIKAVTFDEVKVPGKIVPNLWKTPSIAELKAVVNAE